ncbi:MAG: type I phosphomannose isomerase catalytic subunit [Bacilli bacterium]|jgi:mannose-6-phosphate isomerase
MKLIKLTPAVKSYLWGGDFFQKYGKFPETKIISELWELSVRPGNSSLIASGAFRGKPLAEVLTTKEVGRASERFPFFPILIKLIDAKENLSVQVHPNDEYALKHENSFGKSEMWYIISADEGAGLYVGFNDDYAPKEIEEHLNKGTILQTLNFFKVKPGDCFIINPGTIHAIGQGVRLLEIQQNSDLTYRLYDYNRTEKDGKPRELHIQKALKVLNYSKYVHHKTSSSVLADNQYFTVEHHPIKQELIINKSNSFVAFTFLSGEGKVDDLEYRSFDTFFLPAGQTCKINGHGEIIMTYITDDKK